MAEWFYSSQGQQVGPVDQAALQQMIASGQVQPGDLVWRDGMPSWQPAATVAELGVQPSASQAGFAPAPQAFQQPGAYPAGGYASPAMGYPQQSAKGMAIGSLCCAIGGTFCCGIVAIVGIVLGVVALNNMKKYNNPDGRGLAIAGIIVGSVGLVLNVLMVMIRLSLMHR